MLSKFIQQLRKKNNLTQEFLAAKIGVSRPTYMQIEQGERGDSSPYAPHDKKDNK